MSDQHVRGIVMAMSVSIAPKLFAQSLAVVYVLCMAFASYAGTYTITGDGGYCWFGDPRGVYYKGTYERTYLGWITGSGDIVISQYDHTSRAITTNTLHAILEHDDHDNPSILVRATDKRIMVFYSKHTSEPKLYYRISVNPEDISSFGTEKLVNGLIDDVTYPSPFQLSDEGNRIYLFWRGINWQPTVTRSNDSGTTWEKARQLIQGNDRPYIKYESDNKSKVHFAFTNGHPRMNVKNHIYYAYYYNGGYYKMNGTRIKADTSGYLDTNQVDVVYNGSSGRGWVWDIALDSVGYPVIVYAYFPDDSTHMYSYARWNGAVWKTHVLVNSGKWFPQTLPGATEPEPNYSGGLSLDHSNPSIVYLSRQINGVFEIEKWVTADTGTTWTTTAITSNSKRNNVRPYVIKNHKPDDFALTWVCCGDYFHYTNYHTSLQTNFPLDTPLATMNLTYDMGDSSLPATGYERVKPGTRYFDGSFGWTDTTGNFMRNRTAASKPNSDMVANTAARAFKVNVRNGTYSVKVTMGDLSYAHDNMSVKANGVVVASGITNAAGAYYTNTFNVPVTADTLSLEFADNGGTDVNWVINALTIQRTSTSIVPTERTMEKTTEFSPCYSTIISGAGMGKYIQLRGGNAGTLVASFYNPMGKLLGTAQVVNGKVFLPQTFCRAGGIRIMKLSTLHP